MASFIGKKCVGKTTATFKHECNKVLNQHTQCQICKSNHCRDCHMSKALKKATTPPNKVDETQQCTTVIALGGAFAMVGSSASTMQFMVRDFESAVRREKMLYPNVKEHDIRKSICLDKLDDLKQRIRDSFFGDGFRESDVLLQFEFYSKMSRSLQDLDELNRPFVT
jgi:hypothetical protein